MDLSTLTLAGLRADLQERGLETKGSKAMLVERLLAALQEEEEEAADKSEAGNTTSLDIKEEEIEIKEEIFEGKQDLETEVSGSTMRGGEKRVSSSSCSSKTKKQCPEVDQVWIKKATMANKRKLRDVWLLKEEFRPWLTPYEGDPTKAFCTVCNKEFSAELTTIKRHKDTHLHIRGEAIRKKRREVFKEENRHDSIDCVKKATILMICFLAEHNLPFIIADHMVDLCKVMFPDSVIAQEMFMKKTKCTEVTKTMEKCITNHLVTKLRINKFSLIIDESTNVNTTQCLSVVVKYYDSEAKIIETGTLKLTHANEDNNDHVQCNGDDLYQIIMNTLATHQIPLQNFVGFAADGATNTMDVNNALSTTLGESLPGITIFKCICHSIHLCASQAVKSLPRHCENLIRNIYTHFSLAAKRIHQFKLAKLFLEIQPHKILHASQTEWLSLHQAVERIIEQWEELKLYFSGIQEDERLISIDLIVRDLNDPSVFLYFNFLNFILPLFKNFNLQFQKDDPTLHLLYENVVRLYRNMLYNFCNRASVDGADLMTFDPSLSTYHVPLNKLYLGSAIHGLLQTESYIENQRMVEDVQKKCRDFMIVMCHQMRKRFDFNSKLWQFASFLNPPKLLDGNSRGSMNTLYDFVQCVPRLYTDDIQILDNEWRNLDTTYIPPEIKQEKDVIEFYNKLGNLKDDDDEYCFSHLVEFSLLVLSLPITNSTAERLLSEISFIKTDIHNTSLKPTLQALTVVAEAVKDQGCCYEFQPSQLMMNSLT